MHDTADRHVCTGIDGARAAGRLVHSAEYLLLPYTYTTHVPPARNLGAGKLAEGGKAASSATTGCQVGITRVSDCRCVFAVCAMRTIAWLAKMFVCSDFGINVCACGKNGVCVCLCVSPGMQRQDFTEGGYDLYQKSPHAHAHAHALAHAHASNA